MTNISIKTQIRQQAVSKIYYQGQMVPFLIRGGKIVHASEPVALPDTVMRMADDAEGEWLELGFLSAVELIGSPSDGWTDADGYVTIRVQNSFDLETWMSGNWIPSPTSPVIANGDGTFWYWSRSTTPRFWKNLLIDNRIGSNRHGKSITNIKLAYSTVTLPGYPYAMPAQAATLQADLIAAGYAGCTVQTSAADISVDITNYYYANSLSNRERLDPVVDAAPKVTNVTTVDGGSISLPRYPYQMPGDQAALQTDLRAAGFSGAVVKLYGNPWEIFIPDRLTTDQNSRDIRLTISPDDPFPYWTMQGVYQGLDPDNQVTGTAENLRASGIVKDEADKQFARLLIHPGLRWGSVRDALAGLLKLLIP